MAISYHYRNMHSRRRSTQTREKPPCWSLFVSTLVACFFGLSFSFDTVQRAQFPLRRLGGSSNPNLSTGSHVLYGLKDDSTQDSSGKKSVVDLLLPANECRVDQMSGTDLAYIGDAVFELFTRSRHVWPLKRTSDLQNTVVARVRAEHQSHLLEQLKKDFPLSDKETQTMMRGRNAVTRSKNRRNPAAYQDSTAFECLLGYLYISDQSRCRELLNWLETVVDELA